MRRRLLTSTGLIALVAVLVLGVPLGLIGCRLTAHSAEERLEREADRAAARVVEMRAAGLPVTEGSLTRLLEPGHGLRVRSDGRLITAGLAASGDSLQVQAGDTTPGAHVTAVAPPPGGDREVWLAVLGLSTLAVATAFGLGHAQARRLGGPLEATAARAATVGSPSFVPAAGSSRVAEVDAIDAALRAADARIDALGRREREFSANVSHQLRTPVTGLRLRLEEAHALSDGAAAEETAEALVQVDRLLATIEALEALAHGREQHAEARGASPALIASHVDGAWAHRFADAGRALVVDAGGAPAVRLSGEALRQLLDVLLDNALRHGTGPTRVLATTDGGDDNAGLRLTVQDAGPGIPDARAARIFERHHSGAGGTGVGLALARDLAAGAGGEVTLRPGTPTRFEVRIPAAARYPARPSPRASTGQARRRANAQSG